MRRNIWGRGRLQRQCHYFEINLDRVWAAVEHDLPLLKGVVDAILSEQEEISKQAPN